MRLKWKLISVLSNIVLILMQDRCTVCVECTIGSEIFWTHSKELLGDVGHVESHFFLFGDIVSVGANRCTVCAKHTIGSETILDAPDGATR